MQTSVILDEYKIDRILGRGGTGVVYRVKRLSGGLLDSAIQYAWGLNVASDIVLED